MDAAARVEFAVEAAGPQPLADVSLTVKPPIFLFAESETEYFLVDLLFDAATERLYAMFEVHDEGETITVGLEHFVRCGTRLLYESRGGEMLPVEELLTGRVVEDCGLPSTCRPYRSEYCVCAPKLHLKRRSEFDGRWARCDACARWCHAQCLAGGRCGACE